MDSLVITLDDVVKHRDFRYSVDIVIRNLKNTRLGRKPAPAGLKYRRDWYDRLIETDVVTTDLVCDNFLRVMYKMSDLPSETRSVVQALGMEAAGNVHKIIEAERAKEALAALNAEKPIGITPHNIQNQMICSNCHHRLTVKGKVYCNINPTNLIPTTWQVTCEHFKSGYLAIYNQHNDKDDSVAIKQTAKSPDRDDDSDILK